MSRPAPYLTTVRLHESRPPWDGGPPLGLAWLEGLDLELSVPVTFLVGENGCGKSSLLEALAERSGLPAAGGGAVDLGSDHAPDRVAVLAPHLRAGFRRRPPDGYFFRAEHQAHYAELLEQRARDPEFTGDPYRLYGGRSLAQRSHGEGFVEVLKGRITRGLYLFDEPESALSPERLLTLMALIAARVREGSQFVIATHSPLLMTVPGAELLSLDGDAVEPVALEQTSHYAITRDLLAHPERYWRHLDPEAPGQG